MRDDRTIFLAVYIKVPAKTSLRTWKFLWIILDDCSDIMQAMLLLYKLSWFSVINICLRLMIFKDLNCICVNVYSHSLIHITGEKSKRIPLADVGAGTRLIFDHCFLCS